MDIVKKIRRFKGDWSEPELINDAAQYAADEIESLRQQLAEAQAVIERWDSPNWKYSKETTVFINKLRGAVAAFDKKGKYDTRSKN